MLFRSDPRRVADLVREALEGFDCFDNLTNGYLRPDCQFKGVECTNGVWAARYRVKFQLVKGQDENKIVDEVWLRVWDLFQTHGIAWAPQAEAGAANQPPPAPTPVLAGVTA